MPARPGSALSIQRSLSRSFRVVTPEAARSILRMKLSKADRDRAHELALKAQTGAMSAGERSELEFYLKLGSLLTLMHSKARIALRQPAPRARRKSA